MRHQYPLAARTLARLSFGFFAVGSLSTAHADYSVKALTGDVFLEAGNANQKLKLKATVPDGATVFSDKAGAQVVLYEATNQERVLLKAPFKAKLEKDTATLLAGKIRAQVAKLPVNSDALAKKFRVVTKSAVVGVRGTDFFVSYQPLLGETEAICFESALDFRSADNLSSALIKAGQWGGVGGRFGTRIAPPISLPNDFLNAIKKELPLE